MRFSILVLLALLSNEATAETRVVDGDTLEIDGTVYRLNGIDAPEHGQRCGKWSCGTDATETLVELVKGRDVTCEALSEDGYGRVIATCYADGADIGAAMIEKGMAWAFVKYSDTYVEEELIGRDKAVGIFAGNYPPPWEYRDLRWKRALAREQQAPDGCPIKGNISRNGHIYHVPWSPWYDRTFIDTGNGERWFCSEAEALAAGWRAPYWH